VKWIFALLPLLLLAAAAPRPIGIVINGNVLSLDPGPRFERNLLYVPVRRTIEALGLAFDRSGNRIVTQIGSKTVVLTIGSPIAQVDTGEARAGRTAAGDQGRALRSVALLHRHSGRPGAFRPAHQYGHDRRPARGTLQSRLGSGRKRLLNDLAPSRQLTYSRIRRR